GKRSSQAHQPRRAIGPDAANREAFFSSGRGAGGCTARAAVRKGRWIRFSTNPYGEAGIAGLNEVAVVKPGFLNRQIVYERSRFASEIPQLYLSAACNNREVLGCNPGVVGHHNVGPLRAPKDQPFVLLKQQLMTGSRAALYLDNYSHWEW